MKVTVSPTGEVSVETDSVAEAAQFVAALRKDPYDVAVSRKKRSGTPDIPTTEVPLSAVQMETWNWLVANDTEDGHSPSEVAVGTGVDVGCAYYRLQQLCKKGLAYRRQGRYRSGEEQ